MFGHPSLVPRHDTAEAKREALLAEQRVSAVTAAVRDDLVHVRDVRDDRLFGVARPLVLDCACVRKSPYRARVGRGLSYFKRREKRERKETRAYKKRYIYIERVIGSGFVLIGMTW